ncbi:unnamed protein product [Pleuronectes platessa]|uniref:Uncharacterized protein n=1 Tax=Pleuronectes platessa TaxID=8262 RepID=A0A9N7YWS5_PLEPL|nr:unnamed protein product [Pleuronectes platessa]
MRELSGPVRTLGVMGSVGARGGSCLSPWHRDAGRSRTRIAVEHRGYPSGPPAPLRVTDAGLDKPAHLTAWNRVVEEGRAGGGGGGEEDERRDETAVERWMGTAGDGTMRETEGGSPLLKPLWLAGVAGPAPSHNGGFILPTVKRLLGVKVCLRSLVSYDDPQCKALPAAPVPVVLVYDTFLCPEIFLQRCYRQCQVPTVLASRSALIRAGSRLRSYPLNLREEQTPIHQPHTKNIREPE